MALAALVTLAALDPGMDMRVRLEVGLSEDIEVALVADASRTIKVNSFMVCRDWWR